MAKKLVEDENKKTFIDQTFKMWLVDGKNLIIGENTSKIMKKECETLEVKETLYGDKSNTWRIIITTDDKLHLLKSSRELK